MLLCREIWVLFPGLSPTSLVNFKKSLSEYPFHLERKGINLMISEVIFILKNDSLYDSVLKKWLYWQITTCFCLWKHSSELNSQLN